jgi:hypothetical protein
MIRVTFHHIRAHPAEEPLDLPDNATDIVFVHGPMDEYVDVSYTLREARDDPKETS